MLHNEYVLRRGECGCNDDACRVILIGHAEAVLWRLLFPDLEREHLVHFTVEAHDTTKFFEYGERWYFVDLCLAGQRILFAVSSGKRASKL